MRLSLVAAAAAILDTPEGTPVDRSVLLAASVFVAVPPVFPGGVVTTGHECLCFTKPDDLIEYVNVENWIAPAGTLVMAAYSNAGKSVFGPIAPEYFDGQPDPTRPAGYTIPELDTLIGDRETQYREPDEVRVVGPIVGLSRLADRAMARQGVYDAGGLRFEDYTQFEGDGAELGLRADLSPREGERNEPIPAEAEATPAADVEAMMREVRAMKEGATVAFMLYDRGPIFGGEAGASMRAVVTRMMGLQDDLYGVDLEDYDNDGTWDLFSERATVPPAEYFVSHRQVPIEHVPGILGFFAYLADCMRAEDEEFLKRVDREDAEIERRHAEEKAKGGQASA